ncbi:MAG TPA: hypothetical protein V6C99_12265 [Oculatellaceae cyanobacterium]|jgi:hypothetical protein
MFEDRAFPRSVTAVALTVLTGASLLTSLPTDAFAEKYQSRLSALLIKKTELYLPVRLILGEEAKFVIRAQAGHQAKIFLSPSNTGYLLPDGTPLQVGKSPEVLSGTIPESGVLELKMAVPAEDSLEGKVLYVDAAAGPTDDALTPLNLIDATGRRAETNALVLAKKKAANGAPILPMVPGMSPQLFNQLTTLGDIYTQKDTHRQELLDTGDIDRARDSDKNPFAIRGLQPGLGR